ncbi:DsbA family protein [Sphingomonas immobilis]|uniref:DsbA family protein n=1 Tax=Sphingomonas immobilis TaxID=3063997 RepID=A0ABT9A483_9SPHN|nr:DsbA family protein [Sphingomonas sp. CA1-15]MDO7844650.1 DsbA family protein [Sphingomonas sp. CA1-15]
MSRWTLPLAGLLGIVIGGIAMYFGGALVRVPAGDRARVEGIVHDYMLSHPEILPEAMEALRDKEHATVIADNRKAILEPVGSAWQGAAAPDLTIVEYFDYNCGYCRASLPVIDELLAGDPKLRIVYREFPVLGESSGQAARMSLAAAEQGKFRAFHDALYAGGSVSADTIAAAAKKAGLDAGRAAAFTPKADAEIASNMSIAQQLKLTGTPSWVIGNRVVSSAMPLAELQRLVARARAKS